MAAESEMVYRWVEWLKCGTDDQQYQAALALRNLAGDAGSKHLIREAGGIESLLRLLDAGTDSMLTVVGAETLSCLAADDSENRVSGRGSDRREGCTTWGLRFNLAFCWLPSCPPSSTRCCSPAHACLVASTPVAIDMSLPPITLTCLADMPLPMLCCCPGV